MELPVANTFVYFRVEWHPRRCRSSPPDFQVNIAIAEASSRTRARRRRARRSTDDSDAVALSEFRKQACWEKWAFVTQRIVSVQRDEVKAEIALNVLEAAAQMLEPRLQVTLPTRVFLNVAICLGIYHVAFTMFVCQGVLL